MFTALFSTSVALSNYLRANLESLPAPGLGFGGGGGRVVSINSPREMREEADQEGLSIWLYRIERDDQRLNIPDERIAPNLVRRPPLPLRLHYLMTPVTFKGGHGGAPDIEQKVMGRVMQALHTRPILRGSDLNGTDFEGTETQLHIRPETLTLDETSRVWEALEGSFQLTVSYEVSVVNIAVITEPTLVAPVDVVLPDVVAIVGETV